MEAAQREILLPRRRNVPQGMFITIGRRESWLSREAAEWVDRQYDGLAMDGRYVNFERDQATGEVSLVPALNAELGVTLKPLRAGKRPELRARLYASRLGSAVQPGQRISLRVRDDGLALVLDGVTMPREEEKL